MPRHAIVIGYTFGVRDPATADVGRHPPKPPANYKKEEVIQAWREKAHEKWDAEKGGLMVLGELKSIHAVSVATQDGFSHKGYNVETGKPENPSASFWQWLDDLAVFAGPLAWWIENNTYCPDFWGFDLHRFFRLLAADLMRDPAGDFVPPRMWQSSEHCHDPHHALVERNYREIIGIGKLCREAPLGPIAYPEKPVPFDNATRDCALVLDLALAYQLLDFSDMPPQAQTRYPVEPVVESASSEATATEESPTEESPTEESDA